MNTNAQETAQAHFLTNAFMVMDGPRTCVLRIKAGGELEVESEGVLTCKLWALITMINGVMG